LVTLALGIVLARTLGASGYGLYAYAIAWTLFLSAFASLGMPTLRIREVASAEARSDWPGLRGVLRRSGQLVVLSSVSLAGIGTLVVLGPLRERISEDLRATLVWALVLLPLTVLVQATGAALQGLRQVVRGQLVVQLMRPALALAGIATLFALAPSLRHPRDAMIVQVAAATACVFAATWLLRRSLPQPAKSASPQYRTREWLASAAPLTLIAGAGLINNQTDIVMLGLFRPSDDVGIYRVAVQGAMLVAFGLQVVNAVIAPQFSRLFSQGDRVRLQRLVTTTARVAMLIALPVTLAFTAAGGTLAAWAFGDEFAASHLPLAILAWGQLVNASMGSVGILLNMTGHERDTARILALTASLNVVMNLVLIPPLGMAGAAIATSLTVGLWNELFRRAVKRRIGIDASAWGRRDNARNA
jgi:O-antigen/teichoic acid export membrane protein